MKPSIMAGIESQWRSLSNCCTRKISTYDAIPYRAPSEGSEEHSRDCGEGSFALLPNTSRGILRSILTTNQTPTPPHTFTLGRIS